MIPSARVETAPEQLSTRKLPYKQPPASWIPNHLGGVGGAHTPTATPDKSIERDRGLHRTGGCRPDDKKGSYTDDT